MEETLSRFAPGRDKGRIAYLYLGPEQHQETENRTSNSEEDDKGLLELLWSIINQIAQLDP